MKQFILAILALTALTFSSCSSDDDAPDPIVYPSIEEYISENNISTTTTSSGLQYVIDEPGDSIHPNLDNSLKFSFRQYFANGDLIGETGSGRFALASMSTLVPGFREGFQLFGRGGAGTLFVPSELAYGNSAVQLGGVLVPANTDIILDISALDVLFTLEEYIDYNNLTTQSTASGLHYIIEEEGEGDHPTSSSVVTVNYKGYFTNGDVFDQSVDGQPSAFALQGLIQAWSEGIPLMRKGGKATFICPYELAYGESGTRDGSIPPRTDIVFDIELVDFR